MSGRLGGWAPTVSLRRRTWGEPPVPLVRTVVRSWRAGQNVADTRRHLTRGPSPYRTETRVQFVQPLFGANLLPGSVF